MGLEVKRNAKGQYRLTSTVSDERLHDDAWISKDEAKAILIERAYVRFMEDAIKIDMDFPFQYHVNGKMEFEPKPEALNWMIKAMEEKGYWGKLTKKFKEIKKKLNIKL